MKTYEQIRAEKFAMIAERVARRVPAKVSERIVQSTERNSFFPRFLNEMSLIPESPDPFWNKFRKM
jgi:hypothetical protein